MLAAVGKRPLGCWKGWYFRMPETGHAARVLPASMGSLEGQVVCPGGDSSGWELQILNFEWITHLCVFVADVLFYRGLTQQWGDSNTD